MGRLRQLTWAFDSADEYVEWMAGREVTLVSATSVPVSTHPSTGTILSVTFLVDYERHAEILDLRCPLGTPYPIDEDDWDD